MEGWREEVWGGMAGEEQTLREKDRAPKKGTKSGQNTESEKLKSERRMRTREVYFLLPGRPVSLRPSPSSLSIYSPHSLLLSPSHSSYHVPGAAVSWPPWGEGQGMKTPTLPVLLLQSIHLCSDNWNEAGTRVSFSLDLSLTTKW